MRHRRNDELSSLGYRDFLIGFGHRLFIARLTTFRHIGLG